MSRLEQNANLSESLEVQPHAAKIEPLFLINTLHKVAKKVLQISSRVFAAFDYIQFGDIQKRKITDGIKGATEFLGFYTLFKKGVFWINPFSKENLDVEALLESLPTSDEKVKTVFKEIIHCETFHNRNELKEILKNHLVEQRIVHLDDAETEVDKIAIQSKARSITLLFSKACMTVSDVVQSAITLSNWGIINLSKLSAEFGNGSAFFGCILKFNAETVMGTFATAALVVTFTEKSYQMIVEIAKVLRNEVPLHNPKLFKSIKKMSKSAASILSHSQVLTIVMKFSFETGVGIFATAGLVITLGEASYRALEQIVKICQNSEEFDKEKAYRLLGSALLDILSATASILSVAIPLVLAFNPPTLVAFGIISKSTGVVCAFIKLKLNS